MVGLLNLTEDYPYLNMSLTVLNWTGFDYDLGSDINSTLFASNESLFDGNTTAESNQSQTAPVAEGDSSGGISYVDLIEQHLTYIVCPAIGVIGILTNSLNWVIIIKIGLDKTHNILLLFILASGSLFLLGNVNIFNIICASNYAPNHIKRKVCVHLEVTSAIIFYGAVLTQQYILAVANTLVNTLPAFVIFEQFMAVFFPLKVRMVITPTRMLVACLSLCLMFAAFVMLYFIDIYELTTHTVVFSPVYQVTFYYIKVNKATTGFEFFNFHIINNLTGIVPTLIVSVGTVAILLKILRQAAQRKRMTNTAVERNNYRVSKATKTLMTLCILYSFISLFQYISGLLYVFEVVNKKEHVLLQTLSNMIVMLYASCNFLVSYLTNPSFREIFKSMVKRLSAHSRSTRPEPFRRENTKCSSVSVNK